MRSSIEPAGINLTFTMFKMQVFPVLLSLVYPKDNKKKKLRLFFAHE